MRILLSVVLMLAAALELDAQQFSTASSLAYPRADQYRAQVQRSIAAAGVSTVFDMAPVVTGFGVTVDDVNGRVFNLGFDGTIEVRDLNDINSMLNVLAPSTGSLNDHLGIAWNETAGVLHISTDVNELFRVDPDTGALLGTGAFQVSANSVIGGLGYDPTNDTLVAKDLSDFTLVRFDTNGVFVESFPDPLQAATSAQIFAANFGNAAAVGDDGSIYTTSGIGRLGDVCLPVTSGPTGWFRMDSAGQVIGGRDGNLDFLINMGANFTNGVDISSTTGRTYFLENATNMLIEADSIEDCGHTAVSNHVCNEIAPGMIEGTYDVNGSDQIDVYVNGVLADTASGGSYQVPVGPGTQIVTLVSVSGGETCGSGQPCIINSTATITPVVCPDQSEIAFTQNDDPATIVVNNSIACNIVTATGAFLGTSENHYLRVFPFDQFGQTGAFAVQFVEIGIQIALAGSGHTVQPGTLRIHHTDVVQSPTFADLTLVHEQAVEIPNQVETLLCFEINSIGPVTVDPNQADAFVVELDIQPGADCHHLFFIGSNPNGENGPSYLAAPGCGNDQPTPVANVGVGFPNMHVIMNVYGEDLGGGGTAALRGDGNGDGVFNGLVDGLFILNAAFVPGSPQPPCLDAADSDGNGTFNGLVDGLYTLSAAFVPGSPLPPAPFPDCGPIDEVLGCASHPCP